MPALAIQAIKALTGTHTVQAPLAIAGTLAALLFDLLPPVDRNRELVVSSHLSAHVSASPPIHPSFPGFAFEQASFYNYSIADDGSPNLFSENLINSVMSRTGGTPFLRVGGTSGDFGHYDPSQPDVCNRPATYGSPAFHKPWLSLGPAYWKAFENFPGANYIFMVPLAHEDLENTLEWASQGLAVIGDRLEALEIGNEPDLYRWFTMDKYADAFNTFAKALSAKFPDQLGGGKRIFQALDTASSASRPKESLTIEGAMQAGINATGQVKQFAYHLYQRKDPPETFVDDLQSEIANHAAIVQELSQFVPQIQYLQAKSPGTPFVLSEVGNSLGSQHLLSRNIFATTLWNLDYQLHALSIGVTLVNNQQIVWPGFQMWEPVASHLSPPVVRANYYSQPFVADFIGNATIDSGATTRVLELPTGIDTLSAYAAYDDGKLSRIAIVNLKLWSNNDGLRSTTDLMLSGFEQDSSSVKLVELTSPQGLFADSTITYGGLQWTYESMGKEVQVGSLPSTTSIVDGKLQLSVDATSAVLIDLNDG